MRKRKSTEMKRKLSVFIIISLVFLTPSSAFASHTGKVDPWKKRWSTQLSERVAKTVFCIEHGYRDYNKRTDRCKR